MILGACSVLCPDIVFSLPPLLIFWKEKNIYKNWIAYQIIQNYTFQLHVLHIIHCSWMHYYIVCCIKAVGILASFFGWYYPSELVLLPQSLLFHNWWTLTGVSWLFPRGPWHDFLGISFSRWKGICKYICHELKVIRVKKSFCPKLPS